MSEAFPPVVGAAAPLLLNNVDTDTISPGSRPAGRSSTKPETSFSNISAITSLPCACSSASSGERATLTLIVTATSGCSAIFTSWTPIALIGLSSTIWLLAILWPSASSASDRSRADTEP